MLETESTTKRESPERPPGRLPLLGPVASGLLSLFLASSLIILFPLGLLIAPLALIPVLRFEGSGQGAAIVWVPVTVILGAAAAAGGGVLALGVLGAYLTCVVIPTSGVALRQRFQWPEGRWVAVTTLSYAAVVVIGALWLSAPDGPVETLARWAQKAAADAEEFYTTMGVGRSRVQMAMEQVEMIFTWCLPSMIVVYFVSVIFWVRPRLPLLGFDMEAVRFEDYRSDEWLPIGFAAAGLGTVALTGVGRWISLNILLPILTLYFVHGLAIIRAHLARWIGRGWLVRWGVVLLVLQGPLPVVVAMLGMVDAFRPLRPQSNEDGGSA